MRCIISRVNSIGHKTLAMHTKCRKRLIAYHKINGIITMKKHVDVDHFAFMRKLVEYLTIVLAKVPLDQQANKKKTHVSPSIIFGFFFIESKFRKDDPT